MKMLVERRRRVKFHFYPCLFSLFLVSLSHLALAMLPYLFPSLPLLSIFAISPLLLIASAAFGRCCRQILRVSTSAPALVFFNIFFIWGVYNSVIREGFMSMKDLVLNMEFCLLMVGLYSILSCDPGFIYDSCLDGLDQSALSSEEEISSSNVDYEQSALSMLHGNSLWRVRCCTSCKAYVSGFDHHCPGFGNCIGKKNYQLFMVLLTGFVIAEASYVLCAGQFMTKSQNILVKTASEISFSNNLVESTLIFCVLQMSWQVIFLMWHIYCICSNIKTDEWINWRKYPEFQVVIPAQPGSNHTVIWFLEPILLGNNSTRLIFFRYIPIPPKKRHQSTYFMALACGLKRIEEMISEHGGGGGDPPVLFFGASSSSESKSGMPMKPTTKWSANALITFLSER